MKTPIHIEPMATRVAFHPFLAGLNRAQLALLTDCAMVVRFGPGETIFREGEPANRFYLIESGKVILESSGELSDPVVIDTIGAGELLGWSWMFPPYVWHFTAHAAGPVTAIFFYGTILREYCERDHGLGYELLRRSLATLSQANFTAATLTVTAANREAVALYERMGFETIRKFHALVWDGF